MVALLAAAEAGLKAQAMEGVDLTSTLGKALWPKNNLGMQQQPASRSQMHTYSAVSLLSATVWKQPQVEAVPVQAVPTC